MRRPFPSTLWKHLLVELWRLVVLCTAIVVVVIAFAAAIKPISDGQLDPLMAPKFMLLAAVPMLAYALPFAAGFGTTLAYHRLADDNEFVAAFASGISHRMILGAAAVSGVVLGLILALLNEQVIPRFLRSMEQLVTRDVARQVIRSVELGEPIRLTNDAIIHADTAFSLGPSPDPNSGIYERIRLTGVVALAAEFPGKDDPDPRVHISAQVTAETATIWLMRTEGLDNETGSNASGTLVAMRLNNALIHKADGTTSTSDTLEIVRFLPGAFSDDPKFLTFGELAALGDHPERMSFILWRKRDLAVHLAKQDTIDTIADALARDGRAVLRGPNDEAIVLEAAGFTRTPEGLRMVSRDEPRVVRHAGGAITRWRAQRVVLEVDIGDDRRARELSVTLSLERARIESPGDNPQGERAELRFQGLAMNKNPIGEYLSMPARQLVELATDRLDALPEPQRDAGLVVARDDLRKKLGQLDREILSKRHERWAMSVSCIVIVLVGAVTAMRMRGSLPLYVTLWAFFPALGVLITINGGQQIVHKAGPPGLILLWGGVVVLALYTAIAYRGLAKH